jgi:thiamine-monophosphate kinase
LTLKEKSLIERIRCSAGKAQGPVHLGIGDDAAVLRVPPGHEILVTTDFSLEGVHFRRDWHPPDSVGHRCLARGLSDIAAMGGTPLAAFLSLALPAKTPQSWVDGFVRGLLALAKEHGVTLAGGDTAQSPGRSSDARILADIVVVGSTPLGKAVRRSGAKPGDAIYVTGELGGSAVAQDRMYAQPKKKLSAIKFPRHFYPEPRLGVGRLLRERGLITAMIDLSDGLSTDLDHLCRESRVSAQVSSEMIPRSKGATLKQALHGGEDYELLFTAPAGRRVPRAIAGVAIALIGEIRSRQRGPVRVELLEATGKVRVLRPQGWEHLSG